MAQINQKQMLPMGTVLGDRYRIVRYLASGGFGNTYVAEHILLGEKVAIKEFFMRGTNHRSQDGTTVEVSNDDNTEVFKSQMDKFRREARRIFKLHNDHIIHVTDLFDANDTSYYVMDLIDGTSLAEQMLTESEALDVTRQMLNALETIHADGLYHLDVKPGNIMRDSRGHCTLIDFGASKQMSADERKTLSTSAIAYTPGYAPLEQIQQDLNSIGPWTDFFALGATIYKLVTGNTPPLYNTIIDEGESAFVFPVSASERIRQLVIWMMKPQRKLRPKSVEEIRQFLNNEFPVGVAADETEIDVESTRFTEQTVYDHNSRLQSQTIPQGNARVNETTRVTKEKQNNVAATIKPPLLPERWTLSMTIVFAFMTLACLAGLIMTVYYSSHEEEKGLLLASATYLVELCFVAFVFKNNINGMWGAIAFAPVQIVVLFVNQGRFGRLEHFLVVIAIEVIFILSALIFLKLFIKHRKRYFSNN